GGVPREGFAGISKPRDAEQIGVQLRVSAEEEKEPSKGVRLMAKYYQMGRRVTSDGTLIYQRSHLLFRLKTGAPLESGFEAPFRVELDRELPNGRMPTFYDSPALLARKVFYEDLGAAGV